jgi:hypothetical protein
MNILIGSKKPYQIGLYYYYYYYFFDMFAQEGEGDLIELMNSTSLSVIFFINIIYF